ncbi:hypothetical protein BGZ54_007034 [Gamsiella multidivaricata]|nr:hypothetical protein BGZ54_007034 [Gamsiella multidivaricata]
MVKNTRLQSLHWQGGDFHRDDYGTLDALALSRRLGRLQDLHLECWKLDRHFMKLLRRNPGLRRLALDFVTGEIIHRPPQTRTGDDGFKASSARKQHSERYPDHDRTSHGGQKEEEEKEGQEEKENKETEDEETEDEEISLPDLTSLTVCKDVESGALEALVRLCPNLQELSWMGSKDSDLRQLTTNVRECCPFLSVLTYSTVEISEDESVYVDLIQSVPRLVELQIRIPALGDRFTEALIKHAETLEILDLRILNHHALSNANLKRILMSCHQITALSIDGSQCGAEDLFSFDWACVRLNRLFLAGLHTMTRGQLKEADNGTVAAVYGWSIGPEARNAGIHLGSGTTNASVGEITGMNVIQTSDGLYFSPDLSTELQRSAHKVSTTFLRRLLSHLQRLVHLHSFVLNGVEYTRQSYSSGVICE